jgi:hypothetical protein
MPALALSRFWVMQAYVSFGFCCFVFVRLMLLEACLLLGFAGAFLLQALVESLRGETFLQELSDTSNLQGT